MLYESTLPDEFWRFAMDTMVYVYYRTPRNSNNVRSRTIGSLVGYNIYIQYYIITATNVPIG